jgi:uncharacterized repeat protein (TIGR03847 family)
MRTLVHEFDWPDRVVVGTVGRPGERTFYLQARAGARSTSVALEKEQSAVLADAVDHLLDMLTADASTPVDVPTEIPPELVDDDPLDQPVEEQFRATALRLGWDPKTAQVVIEAFPTELPDEPSDEDDDAPEAGDDGPSEMLIVRVPVGTARAFARRTRQVVRAGRPTCPLCGEPVDPDGHVCRLLDE